MGSMAPNRTPPPSSSPPPPGGAVTLMTTPPAAGRFLAGQDPPRLSGTQGTSYVQEPHIAGVAGDEVLAHLDVVAHQYRENLIGDGCLLDRDLQQSPLRGVHGRLAQLTVVHLAETLQPLELVLLIGVVGHEH